MLELHEIGSKAPECAIRNGIREIFVESIIISRRYKIFRPTQRLPNFIYLIPVVCKILGTVRNHNPGPAARCIARYQSCVLVGSIPTMGNELFSCPHCGNKTNCGVELHAMSESL